MRNCKKNDPVLICLKSVISKDMPTNIITAVLGAISAVFSAINNVFNAKNTAEMKDRQEKQKEVDYTSLAETAVKEKDVKKIRDMLGE